MQDFATLLAGGDRRSIGWADQAVEAVETEPERLAELWHCLSVADGRVRMRAADALEKLSRRHPEWLQPYRAAILSGAIEDGTAELRWHRLAMAARLRMQTEEAETLFNLCERMVMADPSRIVKATALEAAYDLARRFRTLWPRAHALALAARDSGPPALRARARRLKF